MRIKIYLFCDIPTCHTRESERMLVAVRDGKDRGQAKCETLFRWDANLCNTKQQQTSLFLKKFHNLSPKERFTSWESQRQSAPRVAYSLVLPYQGVPGSS